MALIKFRFEVANEVQFSRAIDTGILRGLNLTQPFGLIANEFYQSMTEVFATEGAFEGRNRWQELSPAYAKGKTKHYPGKKILDRTGRLKKSLTIKGSSDSVLEITPNSLKIGTKVPYSIYHQKGTSRVPMRKIIELTDLQRKRWIQIIHKHMYDISQSMATEINGAT